MPARRPRRRGPGRKKSAAPRAAAGSEPLTPAWDDEILTARGARDLLKIGRTKLWHLTSSAEIPAYRLGTGRNAALRYKKSDLLAWLERNRFRGADGPARRVSSR